jgi:hypothetical protein|tara:strand:- start:498 stop:731 length:234 start_codon:yes stop_codon:yes gene_type:complete
MFVKDQYLANDVDEFKVPGIDLVAEYVKWYYNNSFEVRDDKVLDYNKFMDYSYELSEKAAPFLQNCNLEDEDICKEF